MTLIFINPYALLRGVIPKTIDGNIFGLQKSFLAAQGVDSHKFVNMQVTKVATNTELNTAIFMIQRKFNFIKSILSSSTALISFHILWCSNY